MEEIDEESAAFPFNAVDEFKEYMQKELDNLPNDSIEDLSINGSFDKKSSDKENSMVLDDIIDEDIMLSYRVNSCTPARRRRTAAKKLRSNRRCNNKQNQAIETILVGDAEEDDDATCGDTMFVNNNAGRKLRRSPRKSNAKASPRKVLSSNDCVVIDDDDSMCEIVDLIDCDKTPVCTNNHVDLDVLNEEMNVKISWMCEPMKIKLRKFEPFSKIFSILAEEKKVDVNCIVLLKGELKIKPDDTPDSVNLSILDILTGYTVSKPALISKSNDRKVVDPNALEIKVISDIPGSRKIKEMFFTINKGQVMLVLFVKVAEQLNLNVDDVQLWFDGEKVNKKDTTDDLDLEGGECFELKCKAT